ncbi:hypothetical protein SVAN01_09448 [Stagonosporopsis vannaccii]|nr:hypothetical protein SVAN01_09448 [Stagonosporopsis vannaccii]
MWEPFGTAPSNGTAYWKSSSQERGTLSILLTCIITLSLCVYTCLHLPLPEPGKTGLRYKFLKKGLWVLIGIAAPEIIAFQAARDWIFARVFLKDMNKFLQDLPTDIEPTKPPFNRQGKSTSGELSDTNLRKNGDNPAPVVVGKGPSDDLEPPVLPLDQIESNQNEEPHPRRSRRQPWTLVHSHFAMMGGFTLDTDAFWPEVTEVRRPLFTMSALLKLAENEPDLLPNVSTEDIMDKSKANGLTKLLVCLQACWFAAQVIGRIITVYAAWWDKPLDVDESIPLKVTERGRAVFAWMLANQETLWTPGEMKGLRLKYDPVARWSENLADLEHHQQADTTPGTSEKLQYRYTTEDVGPQFLRTQYRIGSNVTLRLHHWQQCFGFRLLEGTESIADLEQIDKVELRHSALQEMRMHYMTCVELTAYHVECLKAAREMALESTTNAAWQCKENPEWLQQRVMLRYGYERAYEDRKILLGTNSVGLLGPVLMWAGALYGGIHLLAWNGPFESETRRWMWRISCFIIMLPAPYLHWLPVREALYQRGRTIAFALLDKHGKFVEWTILVLAMLSKADLVLIGLLYTAARIYLIVECFISLAHLPPAVYNEPSWSRYIPHFGAG